jgi:hypothetical protein
MIYLRDFVTHHLGYSRSLPEPTTEEHQQITEEDYSQIAEFLQTARYSAATLPNLRTLAEPARPSHVSSTFFDHLDFSELVTIRRAHETKYAAAGVRTQMHQHDAAQAAEASNTTETSRASLRHKIIRQMNAVLREQQEQGVGTGLERQARWKSSAPGGRSGEEASALSGNAANAELAAGQRATTVRDVSIPSNICILL